MMYLTVPERPLSGPSTTSTASFTFTSLPAEERERDAQAKRVGCPGKTVGRLGWGVCWAANKATLGAAREPIVNRFPVLPEPHTVHSPPSLTLARRLFILRLMSGRRHTRMSGLSGRPCTHNKQGSFSTAGQQCPPANGASCF